MREGPLSDGSHGAVNIVSELALELNRSDFILLPQAGAAALVILTVHCLNRHAACGSSAHS